MTAQHPSKSGRCANTVHWGKSPATARHVMIPARAPFPAFNSVRATDVSDNRMGHKNGWLHEVFILDDDETETILAFARLRCTLSLTQRRALRGSNVSRRNCLSSSGFCLLRRCNSANVSASGFMPGPLLGPALAPPARAPACAPGPGQTPPTPCLPQCALKPTVLDWRKAFDINDWPLT
jgi:hypothetical protein